MADYEPCKKQYHREGVWCVHNRNPKQRYPAKKKPAQPKPTGPIPNPTAAPIPNPSPTAGTTTTTTAEPFNGTISPAVAQAADTGTSEAPPGGDLTGTSQMVQDLSSVFGSGSAATPQYHYDVTAQQQEQVAQQLTTQPQGP